LTYFPVAANTFEVVLDQRQTPTLWFGVERLGEGATAVAGQETENFNLESLSA
jgi:hypothetical protein